jgi:hypothetical protein
MGHDWALLHTQERLFINWIDTCREGVRGRIYLLFLLLKYCIAITTIFSFIYTKLLLEIILLIDLLARILKKSRILLITMYT